MTETNNLIRVIHAHVSTASVDCDGPFYTDYVMTATDAEIAESDAANGVNDFSDIHFVERVAMSISNVWSTEFGGTLTVRPFGDHYEGTAGVERIIEWSEQTDEGSRYAEAVICADESCDTGARGQRDVYAEQMGY